MELVVAPPSSLNAPGVEVSANTSNNNNCSQSAACRRDVNKVPIKKIPLMRAKGRFSLASTSFHEPASGNGADSGNTTTATIINSNHNNNNNNSHNGLGNCATDLSALDPSCSGASLATSPIKVRQQHSPERLPAFLNKTRRSASLSKIPVGINLPVNKDPDSLNPRSELSIIADSPVKSLTLGSSSRWQSSSSVENECRLRASLLQGSLQLLQVQDEARRKVRELWFSMQRLRWENQLSDPALDHLHLELRGLVKMFNVEKTDGGARRTKTGVLTLVQAPNSTFSAPAVAAASSFAISAATAMANRARQVSGVSSIHGIGGTGTFGVRVNCTLHEDRGRMELAPVVVDPQHGPPSASTANPAASSSSSGATRDTSPFARFRIAETLSRMLQPTDSLGEDSIRVIKLHGCHVQRSGGNDLLDAGKKPFQFQLFVPHESSSDHDHGISHELPEAHRAYVFQADNGDDLDEWVQALELACSFPLYLLEQNLHEAPSMDHYCAILAKSFPVIIPLNWLQLRLEKHDQWSSHGQCSSRHLTMAQVIKDLERDRIVVDSRVVFKRHSNGVNSCSDGDTSVARFVAYLMDRMTEFFCPQDTQQSSSSSLFLSQPVSEARLLAFVDRVLRASSRTQTGGDIYDCIHFFCQHPRVTICPLSREANSIQMTVQSDPTTGQFEVDVHVKMRFRIIELTAAFPSDESPPRPPPSGANPPPLFPKPVFQADGCSSLMQDPSTSREWTVIEGSLTRQLVFGRTGESGHVALECV